MTYLSNFNSADERLEGVFGPPKYTSSTMTEESAELLKQAQEDPQNVDELWKALKTENEETDWDIEQMLSEGEISEE